MQAVEIFPFTLVSANSHPECRFHPKYVREALESPHLTGDMSNILDSYDHDPSWPCPKCMVHFHLSGGKSPRPEVMVL